MFLVPIWASSSPGDIVPHLDLIAVDSFLASPGTGDSDPNWAPPRSGDSGPHLWTIMTGILCSTPEPHLDLMTLEGLWAYPDLVTLVAIWISPGTGDSGTPLGLNQIW